MNTKHAIVGAKLCGCVVAVDLDPGEIAARRYRRKGYVVWRMHPEQAKILIRIPCEHDMKAVER
jgi:hypothetical protein